MNTKTDLYKIKFNQFEGTSVELIKSLKENKMEIDEVPIIEIINDYICFLEEKKESIDINSVSKTINHAALLLKMKSETLLPNNPLNENKAEEEEEEDYLSEKEINEKYLEEYEKYKKVINILKEKAEKQENVFFPISDFIEKNEENIIIEKVELSDLLIALEKVLSSRKTREYVPIKKRFFTVAEKMKVICKHLSENQDGLSFSFFMQNAKSKLEIIIIFLALLQLIQLKKIICFQKKNYADIQFKLRGVH